MTTLVFFGSSAYSVIILQKLLTLSDFSVSAVVSKSDKPTGRGQTVTPNPVAAFALKNGLTLLQLEEFNKNFKLKIKNFQAQLGLCVAFGPPFFDEEMINTFPLKIVNLHPSPLPKYRGATPGPWQIINGETHSAVTVFQIDPLPDHGPVIASVPFDISPAETSGTFYQKAFSTAAESLNKILSDYIANPSALTPQDHTQKTYFPKLTKDSAMINWSENPQYIERFIRALLPWPVAWTYVSSLKQDKLKMKIFAAVVDNNILTPTIVQIEGKNQTDWTEIKKYYQILHQ